MSDNKFKKAISSRAAEMIESGKADVNSSLADNEESKTNEDIKIDSTINLSDLIDNKEKIGSNKTFYLDNDVIREIAKISKAQKVSQSKLVNNILKHVLNIK